MAKEVGGHGGMDFIMDSRLVYCLQNGLPLDMDVYDLAEWCCLAELGAISMDNGCAAVAFPDFYSRTLERREKASTMHLLLRKMKPLPNWLLKLLPFHSKHRV